MADPINRVAKYFEDVEATSSGILSDVESLFVEFTDTGIEFTESSEDDANDLDKLSPVSPPIVRLLDLIIKEMRTLNAERVVITPIGEAASVEFEVGGKMVERDRLPLRVFLALARRRISNCAQEFAGLDGITLRTYDSDLGRIIEMRHKID